MDEHFAARLRELRQHAGLTQKQLAAKAGMALSGLTHLEHAARQPYWQTVLALADALGVPITAFLEKPRSMSRRTIGRPKKNVAPSSEPAKPERPRGRPRKKS